MQSTIVKISGEIKTTKETVMKNPMGSPKKKGGIF